MRAKAAAVAKVPVVVVVVKAAVAVDVVKETGEDGRAQREIRPAVAGQTQLPAASKWVTVKPAGLETAQPV